MEATNSTPENESWIEPTGTEGLVSVVIPTCNRAGFLSETVQSILRQSYRPIEVIIIDDCSTDRTAEAIEKLRADAPTGIDVRYQKQSKAGAPAARNRGAKLSHGQFLVFMDDDDLFEQDFISSHVEALASQPSANLSHGYWKRFMKNGAAYDILDFKGKRPEASQTPWEAFLLGWEILLQACMMQRALVSAVGPWRLDLKKSQDLDYKARLLGAECCELVDNPKAMAYYRLHEQSITGSHNPEKIHSFMIAFDGVEAIAKRRGDFERLKPTFADYLWKKSYWLTGHGEHEAALQLLKRAKAYDPAVGKRNGSSPARLLAQIGLDHFAGPLLYRLFQLKMKLSPTPEPFLERVERLPANS